MASSRKEKEKNSEKGELHCGVTANDNETVYVCVWGGGGEEGKLTVWRTKHRMADAGSSTNSSSSSSSSTYLESTDLQLHGNRSGRIAQASGVDEGHEHQWKPEQ